MKVKLQVFYRAPNGKDLKRVLTFINPNVRDEVLAEFITKLNGLSRNQLTSVFKIIQNYFGGGEVVVTPDEPITQAEIDAILNETYTPVEISDDITELAITAILNETFECNSTDADLSDAEIVEILSLWN